ncbi:MAG: YraN family protein [Bacteroidales bacterium]|nr:YraN family protein [Bacteroidales bacterium]
MKPRSKNVETGRLGEEAALAWLERRGFRLLARNWRSGHKEVDLVMESERAVHIIEVKTLTPPLLEQPFEKVDPAKQRRLVNAARRFLTELHADCEVQFDIVSVVLDGDETRVEYIPEAFYPIFY